MSECACGCGTVVARTWVRGHHRRGTVYPSGPDHANFTGTYRNYAGYILKWVGHDHPMADVRGHCMEHRLVMAGHLGRMLTKNETVHHRNDEKDDNRLENLRLHVSQAEHLRQEHPRERDTLGRFLSLT